MMKQSNLKARRAKLVKNRTFIKYLSLVVAVTVMASVAQAGLIAPVGTGTVHHLDDLDSKAYVNLPGIAGGAEAANGAPSGMFQLDRNRGGSTDHINDMQQQWYWISVNGGPGVPIDALGNGSLDHSAGRRLFFSYGDKDTTVKVRYTLEGSRDGAFANTVTRGVTVQNDSSAPMDIRLYSYSNLALTQILSGTISEDGFHAEVDEQARVTGIDRVRQWDIWSTQDPQTVISDAETVVNEPYDAVTISTPTGLIAQMQKGQALDNVRAVNPSGVNTGENIAFAFAWDRTIPAGGAFSLTESLNIIPEPATFAMLTAGALLLCRRRQAVR